MIGGGSKNRSLGRNKALQLGPARGPGGHMSNFDHV